MLRNNREKQGGERDERDRQRRKRKRKRDGEGGFLHLFLPPFSLFPSRSSSLPPSLLSLSLFLVATRLPLSPFYPLAGVLSSSFDQTYQLSHSRTRTCVFMRFLIFVLPPLSSSTKSLGMRSRYARRWNKHRRPGTTGDFSGENYSDYTRGRVSGPPCSVRFSANFSTRLSKRET